MSQQHQDGMQVDQAAHEAGQYDALIGALNETKASLGTVLKTAPGVLRLSRHPCVLCIGFGTSIVRSWEVSAQFWLAVLLTSMPDA